ncbi:MAG TPA: glycosyltransferase family 9 protein [Ktedonobacterales bacterium]
MRKISMFRPGALGDTILAFPALAALRQAFPDAQIVIIGNAPALALAKDAGLAGLVLSFDLPWWAELFAEEGIRSEEARRVLEGADLAVLWLRDPDGVASRNLRALGIPSVLVAPGRPAEGQRVHAAEYLVSTLEPVLGALSSEASAGAFPLALSPQAARWAEQEWGQLHLTSQRVLALHPGSGGRRKCWPPERYAALAGRFLARGWRVLLIAGPADEAAMAETQRALQADSINLQDGRVRYLANLGLSHLAALLARAALVVGNDSGVSHLSAVVGAPTLALFGPTDPAIWAPRGPRAQVLWAGQVGDERVQLAEMGALNVEEVYAAAWRMLEQES